MPSAPKKIHGDVLLTALQDVVMRRCDGVVPLCCLYDVYAPGK